MHITKDIEEKIRRDFPTSEASKVIELLIELQSEDKNLFIDRILRCIVHEANGRFAALKDAIALARLDYRDLIVAAEYDCTSKQLRDLNLPFQSLENQSLE